MRKKIFIVLGVIIAIICVGLFIHVKNTNNQANVYYRTYTKNGWSKWSKNGVISGDGESDILNIEIKIKSKLKGDIIYKLYQGSEWTSVTKENEKVYGMKVTLSNTLYRKYNIFYRTYNDKDEWLEWANNYQISGNKDKAIKKIQIKLIEKDSSVDDFLEDYYLKEIKSKNFNEEGE